METKNNYNKNEYKTKDLGEAAALLCKDAKYLRMERENTTCWFVFRDIDYCMDISDRYFFGEVWVHPRVYFEVTSKLKTKIFSNK